MPTPPPTLHLVHRARATADEAAAVVLRSLTAVERSRRLLGRPVYPLHPVPTSPSGTDEEQRA